MVEMMTRIQLDLEAHKESQNDRLDEMMRNIDSDVKKVYNVLGKECERLHTKVSETKVECVEVKDYNEMKADFDEMKQVLKFKTLNNKSESDSILHAKVENVMKDLTSIKKVVDKTGVENLGDSQKLKDSIEASCLQKLEEYIGTEILEEIVSTINLKLNHVKAEFQGEIEETKIQLGDLNTVFVTLKNKVADIENPKRSFDESELYTCSIDETRTPTNSRIKRMDAICETPFTELTYTNETLRSRNARNLDSTPKIQGGPAKPLDSTLIESVVKADDKTDDEEESIKFVYEKKLSPTAETVTKIATDVADTKTWIVTLTKDLELYQSKLSSLEQILTSQTQHQKSYNTTDTEFSFQSISTDTNQTLRQESWMSSFMINLASIMDV